MNKKQSKVMRSFQIKMMTLLAHGKFKSITLKNELFTKWLVGYMLDNHIAFKLIPFSNNVTRITLEAISCPFCEGTGIIESGSDKESHEPYEENHYEKLFDTIKTKNLAYPHLFKMAH